MLWEQENYGIIDQVKRLCYKVSKTSADTHGHIPERGDHSVDSRLQFDGPAIERL